MNTANEAWLDSMFEVFTTGMESQPRGIATKEILDQVISFDMNYPICFHQGRKLSYKFMAAEAYWITQGSPLVEDISPYNKHIAQFSDDGHIFNGAYGPAFISQVNFVVNTLVKDLNSRQAVMTIWHPNPIDTKDHKCTVCLIFNVRNNEIHTTVIMRSNDLYLGRPYDMFNFTIMTLKILTSLNARFNDNIITLGNLNLHAVSSHIYSHDYVNIYNIVNTEAESQDTNPIPRKALNNWQFVVDSLLACRDSVLVDDDSLWQIRPEVT